MLWVMTPQVVTAIYGPQWLNAVTVMRILLGAAVLRSLSNTGHALFRGQGKPAFEFSQYLLFVMIQAPVVAVMIHFFGVVGAAYGVLITEALQLPVWVFLLNRSIGFTIQNMLAALGSPIGLALMSGGVVMLSQSRLSERSDIVQLVAALSAGIATYLAGIYLLHRVTADSSVGMLVRHLKKRLAPVLPHVS